MINNYLRPRLDYVDDLKQAWLLSHKEHEKAVKRIIECYQAKLEEIMSQNSK